MMPGQDEMEMEGQQPVGDIESVVAQIMDGMGQLSELVGSRPDAPPELAQRLQAVMGEFGEIMAELSGEGMPEKSPKVGASPVGNAQQRPVGPAGVA